MRPALVLLLTALLAYSARSFLPDGIPAHGSAVLAFGLLLLAAVQTGHIFHELRLPHLTGFLLTGLVMGPEVLGLLTHDMVHDLALVKRVAVGLIALSAGCGLNLRVLRPQLRALGYMTALAFVITGVVLWGFLFTVLRYLPFTEGMSQLQLAVVAMIAANALVARSPAVVIGIISETRAAGRLTDTVLSLVVVSDLLVVITFSFSETIAGSVFEVASAGGAASLFGQILGSLAVGAAVGAVLTVFIARVGRKVGLFVFAVLFVVAEAGASLNLQPLLVGLGAGLFLENLSPVGGERVSAETESASLPTYAVFFAVVGAEVHLHAFISVAGYALGAAAFRAAGQWLSVKLSVRAGWMPPEIANNATLGFIPQAGVALALALLVGEKFQPWGPGLATLILGTVVVNELVGPILWRLALVRAGEAGGQGRQPAAHARRAATVGGPPGTPGAPSPTTLP